MDHALPDYWSQFIRLRYKAYRKLLKIIRYQAGAKVDPKDDVHTPEEFAQLWGQKINPGDRTGQLERDAVPWIIEVDDGTTFDIQFIPSDGSESKLPKTAVVPHLMSFLRKASGMGEQATAEQIFTRTEVVRGKRLILVSMANLEGAATNMIQEFNNLLEFPIRHFTVRELQYDPTQHRAGPKSMTRLNQVEINQLIKDQRGLAFGNTRLAANYEERLRQLDDAREKAAFVEEINEEILTKLPTINTNDPWVKWRGFKVGDVLREEFRFGLNTINYRRVIYIGPAVTKALKNKVAMTKK